MLAKVPNWYLTFFIKFLYFFVKTLDNFKSYAGTANNRGMTESNNIYWWRYGFNSQYLTTVVETQLSQADKAVSGFTQI